MKISKMGLKQLIATNDLDKVIEEMFSLFTHYVDKFGHKSVSAYYDRLIVISGKLSGLNQELSLGIIESSVANIEKSRIVQAVIKLINDIPDHIFSQELSDNATIDKVKGLRSQVIEKLGQGEFLFDVFMSFAHEDIATAKKVWEELRGYGLKVFLSSESLQLNTGQSFFEKIQQALVNSKHFLLICTANAMNSEWVKSEYETFYNEFYMKQKQERKFLIYKGEGFNMEKVPVLFIRLQIAEKVQQVIEVLIEAKENEKATPALSPKAKSSTKSSPKKKDEVAETIPEPVEPRPEVEPVVAAKKTEERTFITSLQSHLQQFVNKDGFFFKPVPGNKEAGARKTCKLPPETEILALVDATVFGSAEECLIFTEAGVHFHNSWSGKLPGAFSIDYQELKKQEISKDGWHELTIGDKLSFDMSGSSLSRDELVHILEGVQGLL